MATPPANADRAPLPRTLVSPHFTWAELTVTQNRDPSVLEAQANPPAQVRANLVRLCVDLLEPARALLGRLRVNSGYRSPQLNASIPGASQTSAHMDGLAADVFPLDLGLVEAYERIAGSGIAYDQLIFEYGVWIHLGAARHGKEPRGQRLMIFEAGRYLLWDPADRRVSSLREGR